MKTVIIALLVFVSSSMLYGQKCGFVGWTADCLYLGFEDSLEYEYVKLDTGNIWNITKPKKDILVLPDDNRNYGEYAIITDSISYYRSNLNASFQIKLIVVEADRYTFAFYHKYDFEENRDGGLIEISHDLGRNWHNILNDSLIIPNIRYMQGFYTESDIIGNDNSLFGFTGLEDKMTYVGMEWERDERLINDTLMFRFTILSDSVDAPNEGWMLDRITFGGALVGIEDQTSKVIEPIIYPNPAQDLLYVKSRNVEEISNISLISISGKVLKSVSNISTLDVSNISQGTYFVLINNKYLHKLHIE